MKGIEPLQEVLRTTMLTITSHPQLRIKTMTELMEMMRFELITHAPRGRLLFHFELHPHIMIKKLNKKLMRIEGFEPSPNSSGDCYATITPYPHIMIKKLN